MISFKSFLEESLKTKARDALATAMITGGLLQGMNIPPKEVPSIVGNYWRRTIAPTKEEQAADTIKKYQHLITVNSKGKKSLDIESIPAKDRKKLLNVNRSGI